MGKVWAAIADASSPSRPCNSVLEPVTGMGSTGSFPMVADSAKDISFHTSMAGAMVLLNPSTNRRPSATSPAQQPRTMVNDWPRSGSGIWATAGSS